MFWTAAGLLFVIGRDHSVVGAFRSIAEFLAGSWKLLALVGSGALYAGLLVYAAHRSGHWYGLVCEETSY